MASGERRRPLQLAVVVSQREYHDTCHHRTRGNGHQAGGSCLSRSESPRELGPKNAAKIAARVDQCDAAGTGAAWHPFATKASCSTTSFIARSISAANLARPMFRRSCARRPSRPGALFSRAKFTAADVTRRFGGHSIDARGRRPRIDPARGPGQRRLFAQVVRIAQVLEDVLAGLTAGHGVAGRKWQLELDELAAHVVVERLPTRRRGPIRIRRPDVTRDAARHHRSRKPPAICTVVKRLHRVQF